MPAFCFMQRIVPPRRSLLSPFLLFSPTALALSLSLYPRERRRRRRRPARRCVHRARDAPRHLARRLRRGDTRSVAITPGELRSLAIRNGESRPPLSLSLSLSLSISLLFPPFTAARRATRYYAIGNVNKGAVTMPKEIITSFLRANKGRGT